MKRLLQGLFIVFSYLLYNILISSTVFASNDFDKKLFSTTTLTKSIELRTSTEKLTESQKESLLATKQVVDNFLLSFVKGRENALDYLTIDLRNKYKTYQTLRKKEFNDEDYLSARVFDFAIIEEEKIIVLRVFLTGSTEGTECTYQRQFTLKKHKQGWLISEL